MAYITTNEHRAFNPLRAVSEFLKSAVRAMQMGRMMSALSQMSDAQLDQIGITRSDIPAYAEKLLAR